MHQLPSTEAVIKVWHCILSRAYVLSERHLDVYLFLTGNFQVEELKAALSNQEYQIITECALSNISETPHNVPPLKNNSLVSSEDVIESVVPQVPSDEPETPERDIWIAIKVSVAINMVELCLHSGVARDASLASVQVIYLPVYTLGLSSLSLRIAGAVILNGWVEWLRPLVYSQGTP